MADDEICLQPATELARSIRRRELSSRELLDMYLGRIERLNPDLNAVVTIEAERAQEEAERADEATAAGRPVGPLHGLPITIKDAIEVGGMRSTGGSFALADHVPVADGPAVSRLRQAGAIVFGKTNVPEWSGDIQTYNPLFGTTNNPWDLSVTPGGSSGGPAAAVAAGLTSFELGTDIGGSIRIPSSFCGVCGHKPSYGIVSQRGYLDSVGGGRTDADINVFGPIARSVDDLATLLDVLAGPNADDAVGWKLAVPPARHVSLRHYRVGLWLDDPACRIESAAHDLLRQAASTLAEAGAQVVDERPPLDLGEVRALFEQLLIPAISVSFEGEMATALGGQHRAWLDHDRRRADVRAVWAEWFRHFDVLLCPVMPMLPFPHDHSGSVAERFNLINGENRPQAETLAWTGLIGLPYLPSTVVPVGRVGDLPVGVQVVGPYLEDRTPMFVAARLEELVGGYTPPPMALKGARSQ
ncbi:MAG TPA: amidase family protein [Acidimicrobiales bacterium]|nr:amidase family protein [Acidimicrobiales bacterium]